MQLHFQKVTKQYMRPVCRGKKRTEKTLELRLPEGADESATLLGAWGTVLIRGKEWQKDRAGIVGGVSCWVLYQKADGAGVDTVCGWIPFAEYWSLEDSRHDGALTCSCRLSDLDVRHTGAGRLLVTARIDCVANGFESDVLTEHIASQLPEDVRQKQHTQQLLLPKEQGEKRISVDEKMILPPDRVGMQKLLLYTLTPKLVDQKLIGDRLACRGSMCFDAAYLGTDDRVYSHRARLPFSFYVQLDREYSSAGRVMTVPVVADMEAALENENTIHLKGELLGQYLTADTEAVTLTDDIYSPRRNVQLQTEQIQVCVVDGLGEPLACQIDIPGAEQPVFAQILVRDDADSGEMGEAVLTGKMQTLCYDQPDVLSCIVADLRADDCGNGFCPGRDKHMQAFFEENEEGRINLCGMADPVQMAVLEAVTVAEISEPVAADRDRPALILVRPAGRSLWELAKEYGSDEKAIREANDLDGEAEENDLLLIPVC